MATAQTGPRPVGSPTQAQPKRNFLEEVSTGIKHRPTAALLYGVPGIGKTSFAASIPGVVFMIDATEDGINRLKEAGLVKAEVPVLPECRTWADTMNMLEQLRTGEHKYKALALDSLGGFERLCHEEVCRRDYRGDFGKGGFASYMQGYDVALADIRGLINALDKLRDERSMSIMLLAHAKVSPFKNPVGADYDRFNVDVHAKTWNLFSRWLDMILFANYVIALDDERTKGKTKARGGHDRIMHAEFEAAFDAKNRHGLPQEIPMGESGAEAWANLAQAVKAGRSQQ